MRMERRKRKAVEDTANREARAVGGADGRLYLHVIPAKETLPAGSGHARSFWRTREMGVLGLVRRCAITGSSGRWGGMGWDQLVVSTEGLVIS